MKATDKAPEIDKLLTSITGKDRKEMVATKGCTTCQSPNTNFRNAISKKEYTISGMCQACQDDFFGKD